MNWLRRNGKGVFQSDSPLRYHPFVYTVIALYSVASVGLMAFHQIGFNSEHVILLLAVGFMLLGGGWAFIWDWLPFLFVGVMFEDLRPLGAKFAGAVHAAAPIAVEKTFLGGQVAAVWLQNKLLSNPNLHWFDNFLVLEYLAHFLAPLVAGFWIWKWHHKYFSRFINSYVIAMFLGFIGYIAYPEMPPWLAAEHGLTPNVHRMVVDFLQKLGGFGSVYAHADPFPNGAMPSLHVTVPLLIACIAVMICRKYRFGWIAWSGFLYPITISFGVVYLGEHYLIDVFFGLLLGFISLGMAEAMHRGALLLQKTPQYGK